MRLCDTLVRLFPSAHSRSAVTVLGFVLERTMTEIDDLKRRIAWLEREVHQVRAENERLRHPTDGHPVSIVGSVPAHRTGKPATP